MNKKFGKYHKISLLIAILVSIVAMLYFGVAKFMDGIKERHSAIILHIAKQEAREGRLDKLPIFKEQHEKTKGSKEALDLLIKEDEKIQLIELVERVAEETGNEVSISIDEGVQKKKRSAADEDGGTKIPSSLEPINFDIVLMGSYESFLVFLHKMENMKDLALITNVQLLRKPVEETLKIDKRNVFVQKNPVDGTDIKNEADASESVSESKEIIESHIYLSFFVPIEKKTKVIEDENTTKNILNNSAGSTGRVKTKEETVKTDNNAIVPEEVSENND